MRLRYWLWLALVLIGAGYFGPWVWHKAAGLNLSADDLGEWIKFLPAWKSGQLPVMRELFYLPIWLTTIGLGLMAGTHQVTAMEDRRVGVEPAACFDAAAQVSRIAQCVSRAGVHAGVLGDTVALLLSVAFTFCGACLPERVEAILWIVMGISAALLAPWMFGRAMPDIDRLYHYAIGWGIVAEVIGGVLMALIGGMMTPRLWNRPSLKYPPQWQALQ